MRTWKLWIALAGSGATAFAPACSSSTDADELNQCATTQQAFERDVWAKFMSNSCARCHTPEGIASEKGAKFLLQPSSVPGFVDLNLDAIRKLAKVEYDGRSILLQKPLGKMEHGGGVVLQEGSDDAKQLAALIAKVKETNVETCNGSNTLLTGVSNLSPVDTLRKVSLDLGGRLPTDDEKAAVAEGGEVALGKAIDALMEEQAFLERVREWYNDLLLTDRFVNWNGAALNVVDASLFPGVAAYKNDGAVADEKIRAKVNRALAREPLNLIAYVVKNNRPFTEVVTAPYTVVNPFSAKAYATTPTFADPNDENEFAEVQITQQKDQKPVIYPHAGVLSSPAFLNRWQTTPTNRNRARARRVFQFFLATDILKVAERPVDASQLTAQDNPTRNSTYCNVCHKIMDPVAGGFRGWDNFNYEEFDPAAEWYTEMEEPGFADKKMDPAYYTKATQWLGPRVAEDPRFALAAVHAAYRGLIGEAPLAYPTDASAADFNARLDGWRAQDEFFRKVTTKFNAEGQNFKTIVKAIVVSPYYRGVAWNGSGDEAQNLARLGAVGAGRVLTPEMLNRKVKAIFGTSWRKQWDWENQHDWLLEDYKILFGGIDSDSVTERTLHMNHVMAAVGTRLAGEVACDQTAFDFTRAPADRVLFPHVEKDMTPTEENAPLIRKNIQHLHERLLGEKLADGDAELKRTYTLFVDTWKEVDAADDEGLPCRADRDLATGADLAEDARIQNDKRGAIRAWQAVVTYLLSDWKFTHQ